VAVFLSVLESIADEVGSVMSPPAAPTRSHTPDAEGALGLAMEVIRPSTDSTGTVPAAERTLATKALIEVAFYEVGWLPKETGSAQEHVHVGRIEKVLSTRRSRISRVSD